MKVLLISCLIYLIGVALVLYFKPTLMFDDKGNWKEFAFTQREKYTWFPFWLFCIIWAIISYFMTSLLFKVTTSTQSKNVSNSMKPGYYVLDKEKSLEEGFPKYVYLGPEVPE